MSGCFYRGMSKLIPPNVAATLPPLYAGADSPDPLGQLALVHLFVGSVDWWISEYNPSDGLAFGLSDMGYGAELGYISIPELEQVRAPVMINGAIFYGKLPVERDLHWTPKPLREIMDGRGVLR